jgi:thymidine kinase
MNSKKHLELIYGPMFSGKTTKLIELYNEKNKILGNNSCLALNYALDNRYGNDKIITHSGLEIECYSILNIRNFVNNSDLDIQNIIKNVEFIFINEAQFFENLKDDILYLRDILNKNIILCGLDLDYKKEKFGELLDLLPYATKIYRLFGECNTKNCENLSQFTCRLVKNKEQILIGTSEYIPVCEKCFKIN